MSQAAGARPGRAAALTPASDAASTVAPPTVSDFALHVPWLTGHPSLLCVRLVPELRPSSYLASGQGKLRKLTLPRLDIRSAMAQSYQLLISDRCSSLPAAAVPHRQAGELDDWR